MTESERKKFKKLFGIAPECMGQALIISPFFNTKLLQAKLKNSEFFKGLVYKGVQGNYQGTQITFINTGIGQSLTVDCLLAQDSEKIKKIIFLGAVGAVRDLNFADMVLIDKAFYDANYYQKFGFNFNQKQIKNFSPGEKLIDLCFKVAQTQKYKLKKASLISVHTLWDQNDEMIQRIYDDNIQCLDLECALFYATAALKKIEAVALCYVSDLINAKPYWSDFSPRDCRLVKKNIANLVNIALESSKGFDL